MRVSVFAVLGLLGCAPLLGGVARAGDGSFCDGAPAAWIWCDDFEEAAPISSRYFEYGSDGGEFVALDGVGAGGSRGMRALWQAGEDFAGDLKKSFGRTPDSYIGNHAARPDEDFEEIYWKFELRMQPGWVGQPNKISRATGFWSSDWSQFMIAHGWEDSALGIGQDPVRCVDLTTDQPSCLGYNDFPNMVWLGHEDATRQIYAADEVGQWVCIEHQVKLNTPGSSDGLFRTWIDGSLQIDSSGLNWRGGYTDWGINVVILENFWNAGSPVVQERYWDNFVISTEPIGCDAPVACCEGTPSLLVGKSGQSTLLDWSPVGGATSYDVVRGGLLLLRANGGDFSSATVQCVGDDVTPTAIEHSGTPSAGQGWWYLVRAADPAGTYEVGAPPQPGDRDAGIAGSAANCSSGLWPAAE